MAKAGVAGSVCVAVKVPSGTKRVAGMRSCRTRRLPRWHRDGYTSAGRGRDSGRGARSGRAGGNAAAVVRTVRKWAVPPDFRISGGAGRTYPSFTVRASTGPAAGADPRGVLTLYADSHGSGPALEVRVIEMCSTPPYDRQPARGRLTADLHDRALTVRMSCTANGRRSRWPSSPTAASSVSSRSSAAGSARSRPTAANLP